MSNQFPLGENENEFISAPIKIFTSKTKEYVKEYNKKKYQEDKAERLKKLKEKIMCPYCEKEISKNNKSKHVNSKLHMINYLMSIKNIDDIIDEDEMFNL